MAVGIVWWLIIGHYNSDNSARSSMTRLYSAADGTAGLIEAADDVANQDSGNARQLLQQALQQSPLSVEALQRLADLSANGNDNTTADALYSQVRALTSRNLPALYWALDQSVKSNDAGRYADYADLILRLTSGPNHLFNTFIDPRKQIVATLAALASVPQFNELILQHLLAGPYWRDEYLAQLARSIEDDTFPRTAARLGGLDPKGAPWQIYLRSLIAGGRVKDAYKVWLGLLPQDAVAPTALLRDGGFEGQNLLPPFGWAMGSTYGAEVTLDNTISADGKSSLKVDFVSPGPFRNVSQLLVLPYGSYRLTGEAKIDNLTGGRGIVWSVYCVDGDKRALIGQSPFLQGSQDWTPFNFEIDVPGDSCDQQVLILENPARIAAEQNVRGTIWFDKLQIDGIATQ